METVSPLVSLSLVLVVTIPLVIGGLVLAFALARAAGRNHR